MEIPHNLRSILRLALFLCVAAIAAGCGGKSRQTQVDALNDIAYGYHYRNLDSTRAYAARALALAPDYPDGRAEALNNLAFVSIARMNYVQADSMLGEVLNATDNQIELLVSNVQMMRLCQRRSDSKNFYHYRQQAVSCMERLREDESLFSQRQLRRLVYARSEYSVVLSTYLYYIGQRSKSSEAIGAIDPAGAIVKDTAQLLAYYYNVGSGGVLSAASHAELMQAEFDYLMRCYLLSRQYHYVFWEANSLQAISEHLQVRSDRRRLMSDNIQEFDFLNIDQMPDSLLAGNFAWRALELFKRYGDVYQIAGAWRTLSEAYRSIGDYQSSLVCLENALTKDTAVNAAPDLVASVREQLSIVYSAVDNKPQSDYNRNIYLDLQERTRQDRFLEARAEQLDDSLRQLDMMIFAVVVLITTVVAMLAYFGYWSRKRNRVPSLAMLRQPLEEWRKKRDARYSAAEDSIGEIGEDTAIAVRKLERFRERNIEQRAKVWLASTVTPLVGRMLHEVKLLASGNDTVDVRNSRLAYIAQVTDSIDVCNRQLTHWIQLRQGDFQLHIESFPLDTVFDTMRRNNTNFRLDGIRFDVAKTTAVVKADRTLTLFMLNTIAGNARRYTPSGGKVSIYAEQKSDCVEVSVADTGCGMTAEQAKAAFSHRVIADNGATPTEGGHGFGLVNCKGIIEKYRKLSAIFNVCAIGVESEVGKGSRFYFRLPNGVARCLAAVALSVAWSTGVPVLAAVASGAPRVPVGTYKEECSKASAYADSAYFCNVNGHYERTIAYADSCLRCLNNACRALSGNGRGSLPLLRLTGDYPAKAAELRWFRDSVRVDYNVILDVRNETAVAALALHRWGLYSYNNAVYIQLFRVCSADNSLSSYVRNMQNAETNRNIAMIMLVALLLAILPAYYVLYYRRRMNLHFYIDRINAANEVLADRSDSRSKLTAVDNICNDGVARLGSMARGGTREMGTAELCALADDMRRDLRADIEHTAMLDRRAEYARDELRRVEMDCARLYVSNNVLDNCLSSLKHETMYYPSRLKQLVESGDTPQNVAALGEVAQYYQLLYTTFISQAYQILQSAGPLATPMFTMRYLLALLKRKNGGKPLAPVVTNTNDGYQHIDVAICNPQLVAALAGRPALLFSPQTPDADFLVCCQIMRDMGESTGKRGCGISARLGSGGCLVVEVTAAGTLL